MDRRPPAVLLPWRHHAARLFAVAALAGLMACATPPEDPEALADFQAANDPLEPFNRGVYEVNRVVDGLIVKPAAQIYRGVVPEEGRQAVRNVLDNLDAPVILANDLLQGEFDRAGVTLQRFVINTTFGVLGVFDAAQDFGLEKHDEDFGQTLAVWGVEEGFFLFVPLLGPSNPRDLVGVVVDSLVIDPWGHIARANDLEWVSYTRLGLNVVDQRSRVLDTLDEIERTQLDPYIYIREAYRQRRSSEIRNGRAERQGTRPTDAALDRPAGTPDDEALPAHP